MILTLKSLHETAKVQEFARQLFKGKDYQAAPCKAGDRWVIVPSKKKFKGSTLEFLTDNITDIDRDYQPEWR